jgi:hypothetical protein
MFFFDLTGGGSTLAYRKVDVDGYDALLSDYVLSVNNGNNQWFLNLPDAAGITGKIYIVKRFDQTSTNSIIVQPAAGLIQAINNTYGATAAISVGTPDRMTFMSNGTNWEYIQ